MVSVFLAPLQFLFDTVISLYITIVIVAVIASWLVQLGILNMSNPLARQLVQILDMLTEPVFRRVRRYVPPVGGLDLSPIIVWIVLMVIKIFFDGLFEYLMGYR
ncbi:MAG TPA: YggT family protein [Rhizomicrobium sp.]|jgi:YggT family protein|nr:YggT family protein [Rhizomicrobium sp.]